MCVCAFLLSFSTAEGHLEKVLQFITAQKHIPVAGFNPVVTVGFKHPESVPANDPARDYPSASACAHQLILPTGHTTTRSFLNIMYKTIMQMYNTFDDR